MRRIGQHTLFVMLLATAACTSTPAPGLEEFMPEERTTVRVVNRNFYEMTIYVLRGSSRTRLGSVPGLSTQSFALPREFTTAASPVRFQADPVGGALAPITHELVVRPGDEVGLTIPP